MRIFKLPSYIKMNPTAKELVLIGSGRAHGRPRLLWAETEIPEGDEWLERQTEYSIQFHDQTKHHFQRYARSLGFMDWANQPYPFRRYEGAQIVQLEKPAPDDSPTWDGLFSGGAPAASVTPEKVSAFFYLVVPLKLCLAGKPAGYSP